MSERLDVVDLSHLTLDEIRELKNEALLRLKEAAVRPIEEFAMHQNGIHTSHTDHYLSPN